MAFNAQFAMVNPRLGSSFGVFSSAVVCLVLMLLLFEQLGLERKWIGLFIAGIPVAFYAAIGLFARTAIVEDFYISGQRAPALYNGLALAIGAIGATGLLGATGLMFFWGFDGLAVVLGWCAGMALLGLLFAPYLRKAGAYTLPGYFGLRFGSDALRVVVTVALIPPSIMLLASEIKLGASVAAPFLGLPVGTVMAFGAAAALLSVLAGGLRSLTWTQCAQFIVMLLGLLAPLILISIMLTNLPLPQFTYGGLLADLAKAEINHGITPVYPGPLVRAVPGQQLETLTKPFADAFGAVSPKDFLLLTLSMALGASVLPCQMARLSATPSVAAVRRSVSWAMLFVGVMALTLPAYAAFARYLVVTDLLGAQVADLPEWARALEQYNFIKIAGDQIDPAFGSAKVVFARDFITLLLPVITNLPFVLWGVIGAAAIAAALAAASGHIATVGAALGNDIYYTLIHRSASPGRRLLVSRLAMIIAGLGGLWFARTQHFDPLRMMFAAFSLSAGALFAPLTLSIWWKRLTVWGAMAGVLSGFFITAVYIVTGEQSHGMWFGVSGMTAAVIGVPASWAVAMGVSLVTPRCDERIEELTDELRLPGGETLHARLTRLAVRRKAPRP
jgi:cation/acetate symporter